MRLKLVQYAAVLLLACGPAAGELTDTASDRHEQVQEAASSGGGTFDSFFTYSGSVDYGNTGCIISNVTENQYGLSISTQPSANATFDATGNPSACVALCGAWDRTFTQWPSYYNWKNKQLRIISDFQGKAHYQCVASWTSDNSYTCHGFDGNGQTDTGGTISVIDENGNASTPFEPMIACNPSEEPMPVASCAMSASAPSGGTGTAFTFAWNSRNSITCTLEIDGVNRGPTACADATSLSGLSVGTHKVKVYPNAVSHFGFSQGGMDPSRWASYGQRAGVACEATVTVAPSPTFAYFYTITDTARSSYGMSWSVRDATTCSWKFDGVDRGVGPCLGSGNFGVLSNGSHTVSITGVGPGGSVSASREFWVGPPLIRKVSVSPTTGGTSTTYTATWETFQAKSCTWELDGVNKGATACNGSKTLSGLSVASHTFKIIASNGLTASRSASFKVVPAPTCSLTVSPSSGSLASNTPMTATWSTSNADSCSYSKDGVYQGILDCKSGSTALSAQYFGTAGTHRLSITLKGPGGSGSCTSNTVTVSK